MLKRLIDAVKRLEETTEYGLADPPHYEADPHTYNNLLEVARAAKAFTWQLIETAPRVEDKALLVASRVHEEWFYNIAYWWEHGQTWVDGEMGQISPTHWRLLDAPDA